ncbi:hypothetical protein K439DRAFT_1021082 [Ramaria rubella]|nr:hypothetical protein K439DRAFT_1021082 [Ramaria rubella]
MRYSSNNILPKFQVIWISTTCTMVLFLKWLETPKNMCGRYVNIVLGTHTFLLTIYTIAQLRGKMEVDGRTAAIGSFPQPQPKI